MNQAAGSDHTAGDGTLAHAAASGDVAARSALVERHGSAAWTLARVLCPSGAATVAGQGIATAISRVGRDGDLANAVLTGVHRAALANSRQAGVPRDHAPDGPTDPSVAALLTLPERWRVALWLHTGHGAGAAGIAAVLGISATAATHMVERATQTLRLRGGVPEGLAAAAPIWAGPPPVDLGGAVGAALTATRAHTRPLLAAVAGGRLGERTQRSMAIVAGGVIAVGVVGIGVLGQGFGVHGSSSVASPYGPGATGTILATPASRSVAAPPTRAGTPSTGTHDGSVTTALGGRTGGTTTTGSAPHRTTGSGGHTGSGTTSGGSTTNTGGTTNGGGSTTASGGSTGSGSTTAPTVAVTTPTTSVTTAPTTPTTLHVTVGGVASVGSGGGSTSITVGSSSNPVASATTCENGVEINALGVAVGSCPTSGTPTTTTTTTPSVLGGLGL